MNTLIRAVFLLLLAPATLATMWRLTKTKSEDPNTAWLWSIHELEFYTDCTLKTRIATAAATDTSAFNASGWHYTSDADKGSKTSSYAPKNAFDGSLSSSWAGRQEAPGICWISVDRLPDTIGCIRIAAGQSTEIKVEKKDSAGRWLLVTTLTIAKPNPAAFQSFAITAAPAQEFCRENYHVVSNKCVACPTGSTRKAGDDSTKENTPCSRLPVYEFDMGDYIATHSAWTWFIDGSSWSGPTVDRNMGTAACKDTLLVAWTSQNTLPLRWDKTWGIEGDTYGHVSTFKVTTTGVTKLASFKFTQCTEMGEVTVTDSCGIMAAFCVSRKPPTAWSTFKNDLVEDNLKNGNYPNGFKDNSGKTPEIFNLYLLEWTTGSLSQTPNAVYLVNKAIGSARYGHFAVSINKAGDKYGISLKNTGGGHEGSTAFVVNRVGGKVVLATDVPVQGCGTGHVLWNAHTYNEALNKWGRWCWTDLAKDSSRGYAMYYMLQGESKYAQVLKLPRFDPASRTDPFYRVPTPSPAHPADPAHDGFGRHGGPSDLVSIGADGFLGILIGPVANIDSDDTRVGIAKLPAGGATAWDAKYPSGSNAASITWLDTGEVYQPPDSQVIKYNWNCETKSACSTNAINQCTETMKFDTFFVGQGPCKNHCKSIGAVFAAFWGTGTRNPNGNKCRCYRSCSAGSALPTTEKNVVYRIKGTSNMVRAKSDSTSRGWPKLAHLGATADGERGNSFLVGWAGRDSVEPRPNRNQFWVAEMDKAGVIKTGTKMQIGNSKWNEKTKWQWMPANGCVAWPGAWTDAGEPWQPYGAFLNDPTTGKFSKKMRITVYCPGINMPSVAGYESSSEGPEPDPDVEPEPPEPDPEPVNTAGRPLASTGLLLLLCLTRAFAQ